MVEIAVVGAGPRGLYAVEELLSRVGDAVLVTVWDPRPPGTGVAYAVDQPAWLRVNVTSALIDGFDAWRRRRGEVAPLDPFPARALLGSFLAERWAALDADHPGVVRHVPRAVRDVTRVAGRWAVDGVPHDEVLLATGHADDSPDALAHGWAGPQPLVPRVYPTGHLAAIEPGSVVGVRGAALTFLDCALALSEGRGGRFAGPVGAPTYHAGGDEPAAIRPVATSGRFVSCKPQPGSAIAALPPAALLEAGRRDIRAATDAAAALAVAPRTARALLAAAGADGAARDAVDTVFGGGVVDDDPVVALRRSVAVSTDRARPDAVWAVGQAWSALYPALVERFSFGGGLDFAPFGEADARLVGVAFGAPPVNAAKLLALIDHGLVDASSLATDTIDHDGHRGPVPVDVVVDAVLPGPGVVTGRATLPGRLVEAELLGQVPGRRGVAHDEDGTALSPDGHRLEGLAIVGKPTEDVTVGNGTLDRNLHPALPLWADRVAGRVRQRSASRRSRSSGAAAAGTPGR